MMKIKNDGRRRLRLGMVILNPGQTAEVPNAEGRIILRKFPDISNVTPKLKYSPTPKKKIKKLEEKPEKEVEEPKEEEKIEEIHKLDLKIEVEDNDIE